MSGGSMQLTHLDKCVGMHLLGSLIMVIETVVVAALLAHTELYNCASHLPVLCPT